MMGFALLEYFKAKGYLNKGSHILDVGSQNLVNCSVETMTALAESLRAKSLSAADHEEIKRLYYFSTPRAGERTLFVSEYLQLADVHYRGIDVCPAPHTDIVDLNWERLPANQKGTYDLVLNLGTTEHIVDQTNSHAYMHDALKVGGVFFHQPPSIGWSNHGYFTYHPQFFRDLAEANEYQIVDMWYSQSSGGPIFDATVPFRPAADALAPNTSANSETNSTSYYNLNVILKKMVDRPFRLKLELATSHSAVDTAKDQHYRHETGIIDLRDRQAPMHQAAPTLIESQAPPSPPPAAAPMTLDDIRAEVLAKTLATRVKKRAVHELRRMGIVGK